MAAAIAWILVALLCSMFWGIGYAVLQPAAKVFNPWTINTLYGIFLTIVSLAVCGIKGDFKNFEYLRTDARATLYLWLYIILFCAAMYTFLIGYGLVEGNAGPYNAIASIYPLIVLAIGIVFFKQTSINVPYVVSGMFLIILGVVILAVAPPVGAPVSDSPGQEMLPSSSSTGVLMDSSTGQAFIALDGGSPTNEEVDNL